MRWIPLLGGSVGLVLAGEGEALVESHDTSPLSLILYLCGIGAFVASAAYLPPRPEDTPSAITAASPGAGRRRWSILGAGLALSAALTVVAMIQIRQDLQQPALSRGVGPWVWLAAMGTLLGASLTVRRAEGWPPLWGVRIWPATPRARWLVIALLLVIFGLTVAARLVHLDQVPLGINPDEGDRTSTAIRIVRGLDTRSVFDNGWYYISMVYFWLLAGVLKVLGIGVAQARVFGALASIITVCTVTWIGLRHFGLRVGLMAAALASVLGASLQFARETSEAGPTATLWTISMALFLEAVRRGRSWAWIGAGLAGGCSVYFYPTGRLWAALAALFCGYLIVRAPGGRRWGMIWGSAWAALGAALAVAPFLVNWSLYPALLTLRAQETSIFVRANPFRLAYYDPHWTTAQLLVAQIVHAVGIFNQFNDGNGFWPTNIPLMGGLLAVLTLVGLGWSCLHWGDARLVGLGLWFSVGFTGVIVTVETPDLQRMATALPVLTLFMALVLDSLMRRVEVLVEGRTGPPHAAVRLTTAAAAAAVVVTLMWQQEHYYFTVYAAMDGWPFPNTYAKAVAEQGSHTWAITLGRASHEIHDGWVRLVAAQTPRAGLPAPGSMLPLAVTADRDLAFVLFNWQAPYLPYLQEIYPGGRVHPYVHPTQGPVVTIYRVPRALWAASQGALAQVPGGTRWLAATLGAAPPRWRTYPARLRWTAGLRVPQYGNYGLQIGPGPARLMVDGRTVVIVPAHAAAGRASVSLARGDHFIVYDGALTTVGHDALLRWLPPQAQTGAGAAPTAGWQPVETALLDSRQTAPRGLFGVVRVEGLPVQYRLDNTISTRSVAALVAPDGLPFTATWTGTLRAPTSGVYTMTLFAQGAADLILDGHTVIHTKSTEDDVLAQGSANLRAGRHTVRLVYRVVGGSGGLEWTWTPPRGTTSIVPPSVLQPPPGAGVGPPVPPAILQQNTPPVDAPLDLET
jgi:hypothetical protein